LAAQQLGKDKRFVVAVTELLSCRAAELLPCCNSEYVFCIIHILCKRGNIMIKEELETTAFLARIEIKEGEKEKYLSDLNGMLDLVEIIRSADVSAARPATHVTELRNVWREDVVRPCPKETLERMINSAPQKEGTFYKVQKVIEAE